jgi:hypothetical protein
MNPMQAARAATFRAGSLFGDAAAGAMGFEDPEIAQAKQVQGLLGGVDMSDPAALREVARNTPNPQIRAALVDRALQIEKTQADIGRLNALAQGGGRTGGVGTGPERMAQFIAAVDAKIAAGEPVSDVERRTADNFRTVLSNVKTYQMADGSIFRVPVKDFSAQQEAEAQGGVEIPSGVAPQAPQAGQPQPRPATAPQQTAPARGGAQVIQTPDSIAAARKEAEGKVQGEIIAQSDLSQIDKALKIVEEKGSRAAGWGSLLSIVPESSAMELEAAISSIDAGKLINQIQALKATSASGATGFGSLTEKEGQRLIDRLGSLRQGMKPETLKANLREIRTLMSKLTGQEQAAPQSPANRGGRNAEQEALINRWMAANPNKSREQIIQELKRRGRI